jgi:endogenous inhibitor of DNA gyrase (YacG/DUF329 family)
VDYIECPSCYKGVNLDRYMSETDPYCPHCDTDIREYVDMLHQIEDPLDDDRDPESNQEFSAGYKFENWPWNLDPDWR